MSTLPVIAAVDGSDDSLRALEWALDAARRRAAPLRVVHVRQYAHWAQPDVLAAGPADPQDDPVLDQVRAHLEGRADRPDTEYVGLEGAPGAVLPELGAGAQLLVLGSRGRGGFASLLLGSNGMAAARDAECPVVVVRRARTRGPRRDVRRPRLARRRRPEGGRPRRGHARVRLRRGRPARRPAPGGRRLPVARAALDDAWGDACRRSSTRTSSRTRPGSSPRASSPRTASGTPTSRPNRSRRRATRPATSSLPPRTPTSSWWADTDGACWHPPA